MSGFLLSSQKKFLKRVLGCALALVMVLTIGLPTNASAKEKNDQQVDTLNEKYYENVYKNTKGNMTSYSYKLKSDEEMTQIFQDEINQGPQTFSNASGYTELRLRGTGKQSTGFKKWANQVGVSSTSGVQVYYTDGSSYSIPVDISIAGKLVTFSATIGSITTSSSNTYGVWFPGGGVRYYGYVNKEYNVYSYAQWYVTPTGEYYMGDTSRSVKCGIDFEHRTS